MRPALPGSSSYRTALLAALCLVTILACGACNNSSAPVVVSSGETPSGTKAPRTALPMPPTDTRAASSHAQPDESAQGFTLLDNRHQKLSDYLGQVVVLDFYATWCPPCREETPHLVQLHRRYGPQGLRIIGLNVGGPDDRKEVPGFIKEYGIQYTLAFPDQAMPDLYLSDDDRIPQAFIFDRKGRLIKRFISYDETVPAEMESIIQKALAEKQG